MKQSIFNNFIPMSIASFTRDKMLYSEYQPHKDLCQFINCYWVSPTFHSLDEECRYSIKEEIIIPDGCLDIIFEVNQQTHDYNSIIVGMMSKPIVTLPDFYKSQIYAIRFNPVGAYSFFRNQLDNFTNLTIDFKTVSKHLEKELAAIFLSEKSLCEKIMHLDRFFLSRFGEWRQNAVIMNSFFKMHLTS